MSDTTEIPETTMETNTETIHDIPGIPGVTDPGAGTAKPRQAPYTWSTWTAQILTEFTQCLWSAWFRTHYTHQAVPSDFDQTKWRMDHNVMMNAEAQRWREDGYTVTVGKQNHWRLRNRNGATLAGEPDIAATDSEGATTLINVYPGQPRPEHVVNILISMYAWPRRGQPNTDPTPSGRLVYNQGTTDVPPKAVDQDFITYFKATMKTLTGDAPPQKTPSVQECRFCSISAADCSARISEAPDEPPDNTPPAVADAP